VGANAAAIETGFGYETLVRYGWNPGVGLGKDGSGVTSNVDAIALPEGAGLGCTALKTTKAMTGGVTEALLSFIGDSSRSTLLFDSELTAEERKLIHALARKHTLMSKSHGKGTNRQLTVSKRVAGAPIEPDEEEEGDADMVEVGADIKMTHKVSSPPVVVRGRPLSGGAFAFPPPPALGTAVQIMQRPGATRGGVSAATTSEVTQNGSSVLGFSTQFSRAENGARTMLGAPAFYPRNGHILQAWAPAPPPGSTIEWIRLGLSRPVVVTGITIFETHNPGHICAVRLAADPSLRSKGEAREWVTVWEAEEGVAATRARAGAKAVAFTPPIDTAKCADVLCRAIEIAIDVSCWDDSYWAEYDSLAVRGHLPKGALALAPRQQQQQLRPVSDGTTCGISTATKGSVPRAPVASVGNQKPPSAPGAAFASGQEVIFPEYLLRQPGESLAIYRARAQYVAERWGRADKLGAEDVMRAQALSIVWANFNFLGCRYPPSVEADAGCGARLRSALTI